MVIDQDITKDSAEANFMNAGLDREAAENALGQYIENHDEPACGKSRGARTLQRGISADQSRRLLAKDAAELAVRGTCRHNNPATRRRDRN